MNAQLSALFAQKKAAEPGLTRSRERELWLEARSEVKSTGVMYWDGTCNVDKTLSAAYASALAMAKHAGELGDEAGAAKHAADAAVSGRRSPDVAPTSTMCSGRPGTCAPGTTAGRARMACLLAAGSAPMTSLSLFSRSTPAVTAISTCTFTSCS